MLSETLYSKGQDNFKDFKFSAREWSAPIMVSADEIRESINKLNLVGRKIKRLRMIGLSYSLTRDWVEDAAYGLMSDLPQMQRENQSEYKYIPSDLQFLRSSQIDEPFLIQFEDGDVFEIDTPQEAEYSFSMNCIPWYIDAGTNQPNVDADRLFSVCLDKRIEDVQIDTEIIYEDPISHEPLGSNGTGREIVSRIVLRLEGGVGICINAWIDYCEVSCVDENDEIVKIPFRELKEALFNYEDLHIDETVSFEASSPTLFFGHIGAEHTQNPYMTLVPSGTDTSLHISIFDFTLFAWSMTNVLERNFDEYDNYELSYKTWQDVLRQAEKIISFETFDALYNYVVNTCNSRIYCMITEEFFWNNKTQYKEQLDDVIRWTELVMSSSDNMCIYGF